MAPSKKDDITQLISDIHNHQVNYHTREIYLHSPHMNFDEEPGVDYRMATNFYKNLHILEHQSKKPIIVHMHSIGGCWSDGVAIYDSIANCSCHVVVIAYAQAASMSAIILQAADLRLMTPNCEFMIHYGHTGFSGTSIEVSSAAQADARGRRLMLDILATKAIDGEICKSKNYSMSRTRSFIDRKMKDKSDWYLNSQESIEYGFADSIYGAGDFLNYEDLLNYFFE